MGKENEVQSHNGALLICLKNEIMKSTGKWVELGKNILSEVSHTQRKKYGVSICLYVDISY